MQVMSLRGQFAASVQQAQAAQAASPEEAHTADDDDETAKGMARLFAEVGESYTDLIASGASCARLVQCCAAFCMRESPAR